MTPEANVPPIEISPEHWEIVRRILAKHVPQYEVWAFGSRAKQTTKRATEQTKSAVKPHSDLDLVIVTKAPLSLAVSAALAEDFSESDLPWKVDVVDWATTSGSFKKHVLQDKVIVQSPIKLV